MEYARTLITDICRSLYLYGICQDTHNTYRYVLYLYGTCQDTQKYR